MEETTKDSRFSHVAKDPRFRKMQKQHRKVKIDKRFQSMFKDKKFKVKYSVDKRGRPIDTSTNENLKKYYELSSDDSNDDSPKDERPKSVESKMKLKNKVETINTEEKHIKPENSIRVNALSKSSKGSIMKIKEKDIKSAKKEVKLKMQNEDGSDSEDTERTNETESEEESAGDSDKDLEQDSDQTDSEADSDSEGEEIGPDYARGEGLVESSSEEESEAEEQEDGSNEIEHGWGELDKEAPLTEDVSSRLAVCNMDWDRIKAHDILVLLNSFKPSGGTIKSVHIYPSEFGLKRMAEEDLKGPTEVIEQKEREEGEEFQREKLREYQLKRLKYYYAVVQCDSAETANHIYEQCDGLEYESTSNRLDLRFIPDSMEFDQEAKSVATDVMNVEMYKPKNYVTSALQQSKVQCTWDETDHDRLAVTMRKFNKDELEEMDLKDYIASDSDDEPAHYVTDGADIQEAESEDEQLNKYRKLLQDINDKEKKDEQDIDMEISWEPGLKESTEKLVKNKAKEDLTPWENYLEKKKEKSKMKREKKKQSDLEHQEYDDMVAENSDSDVPEGVDLNDPYFKEEMDNLNRADEKNRKQSVKKDKNRKKNSLSIEEQKEKEQREAELKLLLMDEDDDRQHFSLKQLMWENTAEKMSKSKRKKLKRKKQKEGDTVQQADNFQIEVDDPRFKELFENPHYNIDPSAPEFKKTKAVDLLIEEKQKRARHKHTGKHQKNHDPVAKKQKLGHGTGTSNTVQSERTGNEALPVIKEKTKSTEDLARLIKSVKAKTEVLGKKKKRKL